MILSNDSIVGFEFLPFYNWKYINRLQFESYFYSFENIYDKIEIIMI